MSAVPPALSASGQMVVPVYDSGWTIKTFDGSLAVATLPAPVWDFASCDPGASVLAGGELGMAVVAVWAVGFVVKSMKRAV